MPRRDGSVDWELEGGWRKPKGWKAGGRPCGN